ncbi:MAG: MFS transporter [Anaerolineales bacterium]|nr:MFS transporter [Anaerolineales bacterium]
MLVEEGQLESVEEKPQSFQRTHVSFIAAGHAIHDTYSGFLPPLLPRLIETFTLSRTEAGLLSTFLQFPSLLQPLFGLLGDRRNLRWVVILAPAVTAILMSILGWSSTYALLAVLLLAAGLSSAAFHATAPVLAGSLSGREMGKGMGFWMVGGELGRALGPIIIVSALQFGDLKSSAWVMIPGIAASLFLAIRLRAAPMQKLNPQTGGGWKLARTLLPLFIPLLGLIASRAMMLTALSTYLPTFLTESGSALWTAGAALTLVEAAGIVGALIGGLASDRYGRNKVLTATMSASTLFMLLFLNLKGLPQMAALIMAGFFSLSIAPVVMAIVQETYPQQRSLANGVYMALNFVIRSAATILLGLIGDTISLYWAFMLSAAVMLLGMPLIKKLPAPLKPDS